MVYRLRLFYSYYRNNVMGLVFTGKFSSCLSVLVLPYTGFNSPFWAGSPFLNFFHAEVNRKQVTKHREENKNMIILQCQRLNFTVNSSIRFCVAPTSDWSLFFVSSSKFCFSANCNKYRFFVFLCTMIWPINLASDSSKTSHNSLIINRTWIK